jgi:outer membrane protein OmpA-like peptidoglycan-associated protein
LGATKCQEILYDLAIKKNPVRVLIPLLEFKLAPKADITALTLQFESGSARLTPADEKTLETLGEALNSETLKPCCFEIQGHTDSIGKPSYNKMLSQRRAQAVVEYLAEHNSIERDRMIPSDSVCLSRSPAILPRKVEPETAECRSLI